MIEVTATDAAGNSAVQTITVAVGNVDDTAPLIGGPSGDAGAASADVTVEEGSRTVTRLTSDEPVTWRIAGGDDQGQFDIAPDGTITFVSPPDFENPADSDRNNSYVLIVEAQDADGNVASQTITVTIANVDDTAPTVSVDGTSVAGSAVSFQVMEGEADVAEFGSDEPVTWAIVDGDDQGEFSIGNNGHLHFRNAPDFEAPTDTNLDNIYVLVIEATDEQGNKSRIILDVTVLDMEELQQRVDAISGALKEGLRTHALVGLSDLLSYNEELMIGDSSCSGSRQRKSISGALNANEISQNANVEFENALSTCGKSLRMLVDGGATFSRLAGNSRVRGFASLRLEKNLSDGAKIGLNVIGSTATDSIDGFSKSNVSDFGLTGQVYGRIRIDEDLMAGAFVGYGRSWYELALVENDLSMEGEFSGERLIVGGVLRGQTSLGNRPLTIDAVVSHATESLHEAKLSVSLDSERKDGQAFDLGKISATRISVPLTLAAFGPSGMKPGTGLDLTAGGLCESDFFESGITCGFQAGGRLWRRSADGRYAYFDVELEEAAGIRRFRLDAGYAFDIGLGDTARLSFDLGAEASDTAASELRGLVSIVAK